MKLLGFKKDHKFVERTCLGGGQEAVQIIILLLGNSIVMRPNNILSRLTICSVDQSVEFV